MRFLVTPAEKIQPQRKVCDSLVVSGKPASLPKNRPDYSRAIRLTLVWHGDSARLTPLWRTLLEGIFSFNPSLRLLQRCCCRPQNRPSPQSQLPTCNFLPRHAIALPSLRIPSA